VSPNELRERAEAVLGSRSRSYVEDARVLAEAITKIIGDYELAANALTAAETRCTELLADRTVLKDAIQKIAESAPDDRDEAVAEALVAAGGMP